MANLYISLGTRKIESHDTYGFVLKSSIFTYACAMRRKYVHFKVSIYGRIDDPVTHFEHRPCNFKQTK